MTTIRILTTCWLCVASLLAVASSVEEGQALFTTNCKACHSIDMRLVGPALKGVETRRDSVWLHKFIRSSQSMINAGDSTAVSLFNQFNKVIMPDQNLTDDEIESILAYISSGGAVNVNEGKIPRPAVQQGEVIAPLRFGQPKFWLPYTASVLLVIALLYYMVEVSSLRDRLDTGESDKE